MKKFLMIAGVILVSSLGITSVVTGVYSNKKSVKSYDKIDKFVMSQEEKAQKELEKEQDFENVEVGDGKMVVSTKHISDAFLSGDTKGLSEEDLETLEEAKKVYASIIKDGMSDYDKEKAIYDWMFDNIHSVNNEDFSSDEPSDTIAGVLKGKITDEVASAMTFRLLANMAGLECMVAHQRDEFYYTLWNICKLDDNCWYYVNVYSDLDYVKYWSFNCDKNESEYNRGEKDFPEANGSKYCFSIKEAKNIKEPEEIIKKLKKACDNKEKDDFQLYFSMSSEDMKKNQILEYLLTGIDSRVSDYNKEAYFKYSTFENDGTMYIKTSCYGFKSDFDTSKFNINYGDIDKVLDDKIGTLQ